jgi:hypothetical protein
LAGRDEGTYRIILLVVVPTGMVVTWPIVQIGNRNAVRIIELIIFIDKLFKVINNGEVNSVSKVFERP